MTARAECINKLKISLVFQQTPLLWWLLGRTNDESGNDFRGSALPVVVELCVARLGIRVAIIHIITGVWVLRKSKRGGGGVGGVMIDLALIVSISTTCKILKSRRAN